MSNVPRAGDLEGPGDLTYQRREWLFERVGWAVMVLVVLAALLGLLGRGPLSSARTADPDGTLRVEYDRFLRFHGPSALDFHVAGGAARGGELRLWLDLDYLANIELQTVTPRPVRVEAGSDRHTFVFRVADGGAPTRVTFHFKPDALGRLAGRAGVADRDPAPFSQFVYP